MKTRPDHAALRATAAQGIRALIQLAGDDPDRPGLARTPKRVIDALLEATSAPGDPQQLLSTVFADTNADPNHPIHLEPIPLVSLCEHHLLPFTGTAAISYQPRQRRVVGVSKLARLVDHYARRLQVQERLTSQICQALTDHLQPAGARVVVRAAHACMTTRGARAHGAVMTTTASAGTMAPTPDAQEWLDRSNGETRTSTISL